MTHVESRDFMRHHDAFADRVERLAEMLCQLLMTMDNCGYVDSAIAIMDPDEIPDEEGMS